MKNLSVALNLVLLVAVGVLYFLHFKKPSATTPVVELKKGVALPPTAEAAQIAYVNTDTLAAKYEYFKNTLDNLQNRKKRLENEVGGRARSLQNEFVAYQQKRNTLSLEQVQLTEQNLSRKEAELRQYGEKVSNDLMREEQAKTEELFKKITDYLKKYAQGKPYKYVFGYTKGSSILYAQDSLDITKEVLTGLNDEYKAENATSKAPAK